MKTSFITIIAIMISFPLFSLPFGKKEECPKPEIVVEKKCLHRIMFSDSTEYIFQAGCSDVIQVAVIFNAKRKILFLGKKQVVKSTQTFTDDDALKEAKGQFGEIKDIQLKIFYEEDN